MNFPFHGSQVNIEMQSEIMAGDSSSNDFGILKDRLAFYASDLHSGQVGKGLAYDALMDSFQITFCGFTVFPEREKHINWFFYRDEDGNTLTDSVGVVIIELSNTKLKGILEKPVHQMNGLEMWSIFLFRSRLKYRMDTEHSLSVAKAEREAKGITKVALNLLKMGMSEDFIFKATGLTIEEIEKIRDSEKPE